MRGPQDRHTIFSPGDPVVYERSHSIWIHLMLLQTETNALEHANFCNALHTAEGKEVSVALIACMHCAVRMTCHTMILYQGNFRLALVVRQRLTCSSTLAARVCGVSCGLTGTIACARMGPVSYCSSTKCTVAPDHLAPEAITALCTLDPYKPFPPKAGSRPG